MKERVSHYERDILDSQVCALDQLEQARRAQVEAINRMLLIAAWDRDKQRAIEEFIGEGGGCIDKFLERLGVEVGDSLTD